MRACMTWTIVVTLSLSLLQLKVEVKKITVIQSKLDTISCRRFICHRLWRLLVAAKWRARVIRTSILTCIAFPTELSAKIVQGRGMVFARNRTHTYILNFKYCLAPSLKRTWLAEETLELRKKYIMCGRFRVSLLRIPLNSREFAHVPNHPAYRPRQWRTRITEMGLPSSAWRVTSVQLGRTNGRSLLQEKENESRRIASPKIYFKLARPIMRNSVPCRITVHFALSDTPSLLSARGRNGVSSHLPNRFSSRTRASACSHMSAQNHYAVRNCSFPPLLVNSRDECAYTCASRRGESATKRTDLADDVLPSDDNFCARPHAIPFAWLCRGSLFSRGNCAKRAPRRAFPICEF